MKDILPSEISVSRQSEAIWDDLMAIGTCIDESLFLQLELEYLPVSYDIVTIVGLASPS